MDQTDSSDSASSADDEEEVFCPGYLNFLQTRHDMVADRLDSFKTSIRCGSGDSSGVSHLRLVRENLSDDAVLDLASSIEQGCGRLDSALPGSTLTSRHYLTELTLSR